MIFTSETRMADIINHNYMLISVIHRFGIKLGFGDKTIEEVCLNTDTELENFLCIINTYSNPNYSPKGKLHNISIRQSIKYLQATHKDYLNHNIVRIQAKIDRLKADKNEDPKYIDLVFNFFKGYKTELTDHIEYEENKVFPYIERVLEISEKEKASEEDIAFLEKYNISTYEDNHDNVEDKLKDLKSIMIKYLTPPLNCRLYHNIIKNLFHLEEDLEYHSRIEEKMLVPFIKELENKIKTK
ncbi:MAG: hypothetical protein N4A49_08400 [Marinifilaceae bacterium]|jgi:regulator of cell morphogenesis and NO signaling|nr:hypothetical protein [Marinifilaceae bacterium]